MKRIDIYVKGKSIYLSEYPSINSTRPTSIISNENVNNYLNSLSKFQIKQIYGKKLDLQIDFGDFIININTDSLSNKYAKPLMTNINRYANKKFALENQGKKVTRKNNHIGKKIIATGLALLTIYSAAKSVKKHNNSNDQTKSIVYDIDEDNEIKETTNIETTTKQENESNETNFNNKQAISLEIRKEPNDNQHFLEINYSDFKADEEKSKNVEENYVSLINKYSNMYGVDPEIMIAIAKQERGFHSNVSDGYATGLMQIENDVWIGETIQVFNYDIDDFESVYITKELISDLEGNIKIACMIFSVALSQMKNNVLAGIQCYNMGYGNMMYIILPSYGYESGKSAYEILNNPKDIGWLDYRYLANGGDEYYLERILSYMSERKAGNIDIESLGEKLSIKSQSKIKQ